MVNCLPPNLFHGNYSLNKDHVLSEVSITLGKYRKRTLNEVLLNSHYSTSNSSAWPLGTSHMLSPSVMSPSLKRTSPLEPCLEVPPRARPALRLPRTHPSILPEPVPITPLPHPTQQSTLSSHPPLGSLHFH